MSATRQVHLDKLFGLDGEVAVVTGASSGIGQRLALALSSAGANVVAVARRREVLEQLAAETGGAAVDADLAVTDDFAALAERLAAPFGAPTILVNAAGMNPRAHADTVSRQAWDDTLHLNLGVPFFLAQALVPGMPRGAILNIASLQTYRAFENGIAYGASKGGIAQLTRAMAEAWSARGITANAIAPGFFPTELTGPVFANEALASRHANATAVGRNGRLEDLDGAAVFLCSPAARYITGQVLSVDGGYTAK